MKVFRIDDMPLAYCSQMNSQFSTEQEAIDTVKEKLKNAEVEFSVEESDAGKVFVNSYGRILAKIVEM